MSKKHHSKKGSKLNEWRLKAQEGGVCECCGRELSELTVDHIVPQNFLMSLDDGERLVFEDEENFRLVCKLCNVKKQHRYDMLDPRTAKLILKYITPYL